MMKQSGCDPLELVSALADGELAGEELGRAMALIESSAEARAYWHACQVAGDVLRAPELARPAASDAAFMARLQRCLQAEPVRPAGGPAAPGLPPARAAANGPWRWAAVAGLAAMALGAVLAWRLDTSADVPVLAQSGSAQGAATDQTMLRDPRLDQLLAAHRQLGGASALQKPAGFLRNATFERSAP